MSDIDLDYDETEEQPQKFGLKAFFAELDSLYSPVSIDRRGENAFVVAVKFLTLLQNQIDDPEEQRKLMTAWVKSVRDKDYKKFRRSLRRYHQIRTNPNSAHLVNKIDSENK